MVLAVDDRDPRRDGTGGHDCVDAVEQPTVVPQITADPRRLVVKGSQQRQRRAATEHDARLRGARPVRSDDRHPAPESAVDEELHERRRDLICAQRGRIGAGARLRTPHDQTEPGAPQHAQGSGRDGHGPTVSTRPDGPGPDDHAPLAWEGGHRY